MKVTSLYLLAILIVIIALSKYSDGYHIDAETELSKNDQQIVNSLTRQKRQLEDLDNQYPTAESEDRQEEPGFWDRIVKVALKLFSKFVEWLNS